MKKTIASMLVASMVLCFSVMAFAAPEETTINTKDGTISVNVVDDFSSYSSEDNFGTYWSYVYDGSKLTLTLPASIKSFFNSEEAPLTPSMTDDATKALQAESTYFGFKIKNNCAAELAFGPDCQQVDQKDIWGTWLSNNNTDEDKAANPIYLITSDGKVAAEEVGHTDGHGNVAIVPANFDGWVFYPMARMNNGAATVMSFQFTGNCDEGVEYSVQIDNFAYAKDLKVKTDEQPAPTADVSIIMYAVAAVTGCGALAIRKKK